MFKSSLEKIGQCRKATMGMGWKSFRQNKGTLKVANQIPIPKGMTMMDQHDKGGSSRRRRGFGIEKIGTDTSPERIFHLGRGLVAQGFTQEKDHHTHPDGPYWQSGKLFNGGNATKIGIIGGGGAWPWAWRHRCCYDSTTTIHIITRFVVGGCEQQGFSP
jgi:hypothetical protein